jgi:hypothetical protein
VADFLDPVFVKTSRKCSFSVMEKERFGLVFKKTGSINSGIGARVHKTTYATYGPRMELTYGSFPFHKAQKTQEFQGPTPLPLPHAMDMHASKTLSTGLYKS